jgi:hypothetical protein
MPVLKFYIKLGMVADICNPSYLEGWGKRIKNLRPAWTTQWILELYSKILSQNNKTKIHTINIKNTILQPQ